MNVFSARIARNSWQRSAFHMLLLSQVALSLNLPVYVGLQLTRAGVQRFFIMAADQGRPGCTCDGNRPSRVLMLTFDLTRKRLETIIRTADNTSIEPGVRTDQQMQGRSFVHRRKTYLPSTLHSCKSRYSRRSRPRVASRRLPQPS